MISIAKSIRFSTNFSAEICEFGCGRRNGCLRREAVAEAGFAQGQLSAESGPSSQSAAPGGTGVSLSGIELTVGRSANRITRRH